MEEKLYCHRFRNDFLGQMKNSKSKNKCFRDESSPHQFKEKTLKAEQKIREIKANIQTKERDIYPHRISGGDADRTLYDISTNTQYGGDSYRHHSINDNNNSVKQLITKTSPSILPPSVNSSFRKYHTSPVVEQCIENNNSYSYENESNFGGIGNGSEDSAKSQNSSKTVMSRKSSQNLRKKITSQCKIHETFDETIKQLCKSEANPTTDNNACRLKEKPSTIYYPLAVSQCPGCSVNTQIGQHQKDVTTEISRNDFLNCRNTDTLTIPVDDVVNSKIINPMIRKLQRMYLNNLKEEMSLMEDLERLPHKVNEVYKSTIFKQKD